MRLPRRGSYTGRLAFDCESGFHLSADGRRVVTTDGGKSWRYANRKDDSHQDRYQKNAVLVKGTDGEDAHHERPLLDDPHFEGLVFTMSDDDAARETSHTDAWAA